MQHRKTAFTGFLILALLTAGLFLFKNTGYSPDKPGPQFGLKKPSQMSFTGGNRFSEDFNAKPSATSENTSSAPEALPALPESERPAWQALEEILQSKNDNDPRLDKELSDLSLEFHKALFTKYQNLKPEDRNGRGTLVFLIARDLKNKDDLDFLQTVYEESPCLNLADCTAPPADDPTGSGSQETSLNYPQLAGLYQLDMQLSKRPELLKQPDFRAGVYSLLKTAENFPAPQVHAKAQQIREKYGL